MKMKLIVCALLFALLPGCVELKPFKTDANRKNDPGGVDVCATYKKQF